MKENIAYKCALNEGERFYEEDTYTGDMITSFPITLTATWSRYVCDLNRNPYAAIYHVAWGKQVWKHPLNIYEMREALIFHETYYEILKTLLTVLEESFTHVAFYDIHSYNYQRHEQFTPLFNLGTFYTSQNYRETLNHLSKKLSQMTLTGVKNLTEFNTIFQGKGYQAEFISKNFTRTMVIPLEIKKVYMNEADGTLYPLLLEELTLKLKKVLLLNSNFFIKRFMPKKVTKRKAVTPHHYDPYLIEVDNTLFSYAKGVDLLAQVNPINYAQEKKRFFQRRFEYNPQFTYKQLKIGPYEYREKLYSIPVDHIQDVSQRQMYRDCVDSYAARIDLLTSIGTENFLYNSLRFFGEPNKKDIDNASFLLYAPTIETEKSDPINAEMLYEAFIEAIEEYQIECKVELTSKIVASAMVNNAKSTILINKNALFSHTEKEALIHHELGVHMLTNLNAKR